MNEDVVLNVTSHGAERNPSGLNGWMFCVRRIRYRTRKKTKLKTTVVLP